MKPLRPLVIASVSLLLLMSAVPVGSVSAAPTTRTPFGPMPELCVHRVPSGTLIASNTTSTMALLPNGTAVTYPRCPHSGSVVPQVSPWVEWGQYELSSSALTHYSGKWTVPSAPSSSDGQTLFYWIGSEDADNYVLLQPVLQWGDSYCGGGAYWAIASWVASSTGNAYCSALKTVSTGDTINGTINYTGTTCERDAHACFSITATDTSSGKSTSLTNQDYNFQWWTYGNLETYYIQSCNDYPTGGSVALKSLTVRDGSGNVSPTWTTKVNTQASPQCSFSVGTTSSKITLYYST
jgi:hypothetical protein